MIRLNRFDRKRLFNLYTDDTIFEFKLNKQAYLDILRIAKYYYIPEYLRSEFLTMLNVIETQAADHVAISATILRRDLNL